MPAKAKALPGNGAAPQARAPALLEAAIGYEFRDPALLLRALSHKSCSAGPAGGTERGGDNEQLEFLGDAVLGFVVSDWLVRRYPSLPEGRLSKLKAHLVSAAHLFPAAVRLDLGAYLRLGRGEELSGGRSKKGLLADALEALIAAVYLDGGMEAAARVVSSHVIGAFDAADLGVGDAGLDFKSALQELTQTLKLPAPRYHVVREQGPEHAKTFTVEVRLGKDLARQGEGPSKKSAGQQAARQAFEELTAAALRPATSS